VLTASWIPALGLIAGLDWATPRAAELAHWGALGFAGVAPLVDGFRALSAAGEHEGEVLREWARKCLRPAWLFATGVQGIIGFVPHPTTPVIVALMAATVPLGVYGVMLVRDAAGAE